ncbi:MAG TPA: hypothetical protein VFX70_13585 [Mycobacteriales bacterium]|nr:hypothetical protein [Mycobacteriales bacterium]
MAHVPPLVHEAMRRAGLVWLRPTDPPGTDRPTPAWLLWRDGAAYLLTGPGEQPAPGMATAHAAEVTVGPAHADGRLMRWLAVVSRVEPGGPEWRSVVPALATRRLNAPDPGTSQDRWAAECDLLRLDPTGDVNQT